MCMRGDILYLPWRAVRRRERERVVGEECEKKDTTAPHSFHTPALLSQGEAARLPAPVRHWPGHLPCSPLPPPAWPAGDRGAGEKDVASKKHTPAVAPSSLSISHATLSSSYSPALACLQNRTVTSSGTGGGGGGKDELPAQVLTSSDLHSPSSDLLPTTSASTLLPDASSPVAAVADALQGLHTMTGLPWWATLPLAAVSVRVALSPLALASARSAAASGPLLREARKMAAEAAGTGGDTDTPTPPSPRTILTNFTRLRAAASAPHPAWIVAAPLAQLPVLALAVLGVRAMATGDWPGLADGGVLWFPDLTARAVEVGSVAVADTTTADPALLNPSSSTLVAPLGPAGAALPAAVAGTLLASAAIGPGRAAASGSGLARHLRLLVEWCALPAFLAAAALPQGAALYWAASSGAAVAQSLALQSEAGRSLVMRGLGLPAPAAAAKLLTEEEGKQKGEVEGATPRPPPSLNPAAALAAAGPAGPHLVAAATARAAGDSEMAVRAALAATKAAPTDPRAFFALGQLRAGGRDWAGAAAALAKATELLSDTFTITPGLQPPSARSALASRAHMALGVARAMEGQVSEAAVSFAEAAAAARASKGVEGDQPLITAAAKARAASRPMPSVAAFIARAHLARAAALAEDGKLEEALEAARAGAALEPAAVETHVRGLEQRVRGGEG